MLLDDAVDGDEAVGVDAAGLVDVELDLLPHALSSVANAPAPATELFPSELLDDMAVGSLSDEAAERWLSADAGSGPVGFAYCVPERMTEGTWNLLAIAVHPAHQSRGVGKALLEQIERELAAQAQRVLLVETSGLPEFKRTRAFYRTNRYTEEGRIRDFYATGDDKVIFWKALR